VTLRARDVRAGGAGAATTVVVIAAAGGFAREDRVLMAMEEEDWGDRQSGSRN
jgi:hypothetical protein